MPEAADLAAMCADYDRAIGDGLDLPLLGIGTNGHIGMNEPGSSYDSVTRRVDLGPGTNSVWAYINLPRYKQGIRVDTNGDGKPDAVLPAASNFLAGVSPAMLKEAPPLPRLAATAIQAQPIIACPVGQCAYHSCHCAPPDSDPPPQWNQSSNGCASEHLHCIWTCAPASACTVVAQPVNPAQE